MESYLIGAVALAALYKVTNKDPKSKSKINSLNETFSNNSSIQAHPISNINTASDINITPTSTNDNQSSSFTSLTGEKISSNSLQHNNMVHFYGTTQPGRYFNESNSDSRLDNMVGSSSTTIHKSSQPPLFAPQNNLQWVNGTPNNTEFIKSRMHQSSKKHNEIAWVSENVGPGLTKKYDTEGTHGFNSAYMARDQWQPKTVDDLRTINNPKQTFTLDEHKGPAHSAVQTINEHTKVNKHRPDTYFHNGPARYFTSNVINNPSLQPESLTSAKTNNRTTTHAEYTGIPGTASIPEGNKPIQNFDKQNREHIYKEMIGTPSSSMHQVHKNNKNSYNNRSTYRSSNSQENTNLNFQGLANPMGYINKSDNPDNYSKKEELINNHNNGIISKIGSGGQPLYDPNDIPNPTIKETTMYSTTDNPFISKDIEQILPNQKIRNKTNRSNTSQFTLGTPNNHLYGTHDNTAVYNQRNNHNKVTKPWTPAGNIKDFNNSINMETVSRRERDNLQNRENFKMQYNAVVPNKQIIGSVQLPKENNTPITDFLNSDLLTSFKENPYTHSLHSVA